MAAGPIFFVDFVLVVRSFWFSALSRVLRSASTRKCAGQICIFHREQKDFPHRSFSFYRARPRFCCLIFPDARYRGKDAPSSASIRSPAPAAFAARQGAFLVWFAGRIPMPVLDFSVRPLNFSSPRIDNFDVEFVFPRLIFPALLCRMRTVFPLVGAAPLEFSAPTPRLPYLRSFLLSGV
jgi:hypothetical protein